MTVSKVQASSVDLDVEGGYDIPCDDVTSNDKCWVTLEGSQTSVGSWSTYIYDSDNSPSYYVCGIKYVTWFVDGVAEMYQKYCNIANWSD